MKKIVFIAVFMIVSALPASAQVSFGIKAGANINTATLVRFYDSNESTENNPMGYHFGFVSLIRTPLPHFRIRPEVLFNSNTTRFVFNLPIDQASRYDFRIKRTELNIPILAEYKLSLFRFNAGPVLKFSFKDRFSTTDPWGKLTPIEFEKKYIGYQAGVGIDLLSFTFDIRYNGNFSKVNGEIYAYRMSYATGYIIFPTQLKSRGGQVMFSLGYMF